jgi:hypothetical protein
MSTDPAVRRYLTRLRRARMVYAAVVTAIVVVVGAGVAFAWTNGEIAHVSLHTVRSGPPTLPVAAPSQPLQVAWRTPDRAAIGDPQWRGTVVTYAAHTVRGRDARTGQQTWSYTRTDRSVCTAAQVSGVTVAVYDDGGNCDEITALNSNTGAREWTRTLDEDGKPVNGQPRYQTFTGGSYPVLVIWTAQVIYAIDTDGGLDSWTWYHYGCTIHHVVLGSAGALISQTCTKAQNCNGHKMCGPGPQLVLRDGAAGYDDSNTTNPDQVIWNLFGNTDVPVSADSLISALDPRTRALDTFSAEYGHPTGSVPLVPPPLATGPVFTIATTPDQLIWIAGRTYAVSDGKVRWTARTDAAPTVVSSGAESVPELSSARITAPVGGRIASVSTRTGRVIARFVAVSGGARTAVWPLGTGFLAGTPDGTVAYR